jgi:hypothetical protein
VLGHQWYELAALLLQRNTRQQAIPNQIVYLVHVQTVDSIADYLQRRKTERQECIGACVYRMPDVIPNFALRLQRCRSL